LKAVTIVWIAEHFTEEHRAALDWLNDFTADEINFFGLEVELWKIGSSPAAPKFNIVSSPNDWSKTISSVAEGELTETKLLQQEYWAALREVLIDRKSVVKPQKPLPQHWANFAVGRSYFWMNATVNTQKKVIQVSLSCNAKEALAYFRLLEHEKEAIEEEIGEALDWEELPSRKEKRIAIRKNNADPTNKADWPAQHQWMAEKLEAFYKSFSPRVKELDAAEYEPPEDE